MSTNYSFYSHRLPSISYFFLFHLSRHMNGTPGQRLLRVERRNSALRRLHRQMNHGIISASAAPNTSTHPETTSTAEGQTERPSAENQDESSAATASETAADQATPTPPSPSVPSAGDTTETSSHPPRTRPPMRRQDLADLLATNRRLWTRMEPLMDRWEAMLRSEGEIQSRLRQSDEISSSTPSQSGPVPSSSDNAQPERMDTGEEVPPPVEWSPRVVPFQLALEIDCPKLIYFSLFSFSTKSVLSCTCNPTLFTCCQISPSAYNVNEHLNQWAQPQNLAPPLQMLSQYLLQKLNQAPLQ